MKSRVARQAVSQSIRGDRLTSGRVARNRYTEKIITLTRSCRPRLHSTDLYRGNVTRSRPLLSMPASFLIVSIRVVFHREASGCT